MLSQYLRRDTAAVVRPGIASSDIAAAQRAAVLIVFILLFGTGLVVRPARPGPPAHDETSTIGTASTYDLPASVLGGNGGLRRPRYREPSRTPSQRQPSTVPSAPPREGRVAVVTGGSQGLGLQIVRMLAERGMRVVLACRSAPRGRAAVDLLGDLADRVAVRELDITDPASVQRLVTWLDRRLGRCDVLVNNAAGLADEVPTNDPDLVRFAVEADLLGTWRLTQALVPLMRSHGYGRVVNVSSGLPGYRVAKRAVNTLTRTLADELAADGILVNACCPGGTRFTFRVGRSAVPADTSVRLATLPDGGPTGRCYR
jgi:NAD(P)-dependent dehydrogenase (short-subunit alcohol dehydrogenase family)